MRAGRNRKAAFSSAALRQSARNGVRYFPAGIRQISFASDSDPNSYGAPHDRRVRDLREKKSDREGTSSDETEEVPVDKQKYDAAEQSRAGHAAIRRRVVQGQQQRSNLRRSLHGADVAEAPSGPSRKGPTVGEFMKLFGYGNLAPEASLPARLPPGSPDKSDR
ncbi:MULTISPECIES: hypothetical protein [unclassified Bradyrhizobium]